ncbi:hypothetical protein BRADI_1g45272v3 [Brachypodium distachyon]|uniref:Uncharacterized protein n=1 Tax=Brachypodium distachyon TaxID=15368 RepID=A0A2K2DPG3_BRADI|nr:hypothetical protein BRADI_1g45272v3 [Brachypodium distachyon]
MVRGVEQKAGPPSAVGFSCVRESEGSNTGTKRGAGLQCPAAAGAVRGGLGRPGFGGDGEGELLLHDSAGGDSGEEIKGIRVFFFFEGVDSGLCCRFFSTPRRGDSGFFSMAAQAEYYSRPKPKPAPRRPCGLAIF